MAVEQVLDAARASVPGCSIAAFGDASTRLILRSSHHDTIRRETLDQLCDEAAKCFNLMDAADGLYQAFAGDEVQRTQAMTMRNRNSAVFVRSDTRSSEFLCLVCAAPADSAAMSAAAHQALQEIVKV